MGGWANAMRERKKRKIGKMNLETWAYSTGGRKKKRKQDEEFGKSWAGSQCNHCILHPIKGWADAMLK